MLVQLVLNFSDQLVVGPYCPFELSTVRSEHRELLMSQSVLFAFSSCNQDIDEDMSSLNIFNH